ncbi:MAG: CBS domain-containing protein [Thermoplasmata archaeon]|jgi:CBS domain-containing protein|nr:CBS domain-containing protein [Thermoplasmata archaeon]MVT15289.1 CBS domain-containing protein [Euryarchaeota archaeon]MVT35173.1 CBS domain-containing protein [Euryarchaeota archaeon]
MKVLKVKDAMSANIIFLDKETPISDAVKEMIDKNTYAIIVLDEAKPKGIVTERDLTVKVLSKKIDPKVEKIGNIMSSPLITVSPDELLENAARMMIDRKIRKLPVMENGNIVGIVTEDDIIRISPYLMSLVCQMVTDWKSEILKWLTSGSDKSEDPANLIWDVKVQDNLIIAEHPKVPFILHITFVNRIIKMDVYTGLETALLDPIQRLDISRKLLFLNDRTALVKFTIRGINEEIVLSSDLDLASINKEEFSDALTGLITALYMMIKEFKLEEEFNKQLAERVVLMVKERMNMGATRDDLMSFLINKVGLDEDNARKLLDEIIKGRPQDEHLSSYI